MSGTQPTGHHEHRDVEINSRDLEIDRLIQDRVHNSIDLFQDARAQFEAFRTENATAIPAPFSPEKLSLAGGVLTALQRSIDDTIDLLNPSYRKSRRLVNQLNDRLALLNRMVAYIYRPDLEDQWF
jgi:hypothetical protein